MENITIIDVVATEDPTTVVATIEANIGEGLEALEYVLNFSDPHGIAPAVQSAVDAWIGAGGVISPYEAPPITPEQVDVERAKRTEERFFFNGKRYDYDARGKTNIAGGSTLALGAIVAGAPEGFYRWHDGETDFTWIAYDNTRVTMDAQTVWALGRAAAAHEDKHTKAARDLKDLEVIPQDYTDDKYWP